MNRAMAKAKQHILKIDEDFKRLCPPLSDSEYASLEASIIDEGCREALVVWNGVIVDGHNRYGICTKRGLKFRSIEKEFANRDDAKRWILQNQLGRRNLSNIHASYLRGVFYRLVRKKNGGARVKWGSGGKSTQDLLAEQFNVCPSTIRNDVQVADALDKLTPDARDFVLNREATARKQHVIDISQLTPPSQDIVVKKIRSGEIPNLAKAVGRLRPKAISGMHSVRCKGCGARLAPGVATCLKCDLNEADVEKKLSTPDRFIDDNERPPEIAERIAALRGAKMSGDEIKFHADWIVGWLSRNELERNSTSHRTLHGLYKKLQDRLGKGKFDPWTKA